MRIKRNRYELQTVDYRSFHCNGCLIGANNITVFLTDRTWHNVVKCQQGPVGFCKIELILLMGLCGDRGYKIVNAHLNKCFMGLMIFSMDFLGDCGFFIKLV